MSTMPKYVKWSIADLPILPQKWQYLVSASTKKQFGILQKLMHRPDVDSIVICATDAGREGELIFRLVYQQAGCKKPFSRLWLSSMEENAIREGFAHLKPSTEYDALYNAALCRERADWMVGINASRLFSCLYGQPLAVGRVMTPVLAMTVVREAAIAAFVPEKFYTVALTLDQTAARHPASRICPESGCRTTCFRNLPKGGACQRCRSMEPQGKVRKSAAALRPYRTCSGMPTVCWGLRHSRPWIMPKAFTKSGSSPTPARTADF
ncbi:MAG: DNA topoisomerase [Faecalibacterium sp.]